MEIERAYTEFDFESYQPSDHLYPTSNIQYSPLDINTRPGSLIVRNRQCHTNLKSRVIHIVTLVRQNPNPPWRQHHWHREINSVLQPPLDKDSEDQAVRHL